MCVERASDWRSRRAFPGARQSVLAGSAPYMAANSLPAAVATAGSRGAVLEANPGLQMAGTGLQHTQYR